jgi:hypothetical protein
MTENPVRSLLVLPYLSRRSNAALLCCAALALGGCAMKRRPSISWATAIQVKPVMQTHNAGTGDASEDPGPELRLDLPPFPGHLTPVRTAPPRPRTSTPLSTAAGTDAEKSEAPLIAPQLSPQESAVARQQTNQSLSVAEKNLASARGKTLDAAQSDLASKIRGFIKDAREAARIADWSSARNLAKKAEVLSEELAGSL